MVRLAFILILSMLTFSVAQENPIPARPSKALIQELIEDFQSRSFIEREKAQQQLRAIGFHHPDFVLEPLAEAWFSAPNEESSFRLYSCIFGIKNDLFYKNPIGFVGISMLPAGAVVGNQRRDCILVRDVVPGTAAQKANLQINDRILSVDGQTFDGLPNRTTFFSEYVRSKRPGEKIEIEIVRGAEILTMDVELGERPQRYNNIWQDRVALEGEFSEFLDTQRKRLGLDEEKEEKGETPKPPILPESSTPSSDDSTSPLKSGQP